MEDGREVDKSKEEMSRRVRTENGREFKFNSNLNLNSIQFKFKFNSKFKIQVKKKQKNFNHPTRGNFVVVMAGS